MSSSQLSPVWVSGEFSKMIFNRVLDDDKDYLNLKIVE